MDRNKAIDILRVIAPPRTSKKAFYDFMEARDMAIAALEKVETNRPEIPDSWIPVTKKMPEEKDTMFAKYWGTDRWNKYMFRKRSDMVEVTVELDDGTRVTEASRTRDGKWAIEEEYGFVHKKVVAWHPMSEPWRGE